MKGTLSHAWGRWGQDVMSTLCQNQTPPTPHAIRWRLHSKQFFWPFFDPLHRAAAYREVSH